MDYGCTETLCMLEGSWSVLPGDEGCEYSERGQRQMKARTKGK